MYFRIPFASSGTTTAIPDTQPGNGAVNWATGYTNVYQLNPDTDPLALRIERAQFNYVMNQLTATLKQLYENGVPPFIETADNGGSPYSYSKDALVKRAGVVYSSNVNSNTTAPPGANWTVVDMAVFNAKAPTNSPTFTGTPLAPTAASTTNSAQIATTAFVRSAMQLFGVGGAGAVRVTNLNTLVDGGMYYFLSTDSGIPGTFNGNVLHVPWGDTSAAYQIAVHLFSSEIFFRAKSNNVWGSWFKVYHGGNSNPIVQWGSSLSGHYNIFKNGAVDIFKTHVHNGTTSLVSMPVAITNATGAVGHVTPLSNSPSPYGLTITSSGYFIYGPAATVYVRLYFPEGVPPQ